MAIYERVDEPDTFRQSPRASKIYTVQWGEYQLARDDAINTSVWLSSSGIVLTEQLVYPRYTAVRISGGDSLTTYSITNRITTNKGEWHDWTFQMRIEDVVADRKVTQDPDAKLDYAFDWGQRYLRRGPDNELLQEVGAAWVEAGSMTVEVPQVTTEVVYAGLSGGTKGDTYPFECIIHTDDGSIDVYIVNVDIREK